MRGLGTIINTTAVIIGGLIGIFLRRGMSEGIKKILIQACGIAVVFIGISGTLSRMITVSDGKCEAGGTMLLIISLVAGGLIGQLIGIERRLESFGEGIKTRVKANNDNSFVEAFVNTSLVVCVGAMAIVGSIEDGISGNFSTLAVKALLDFIIVMVMASASGAGAVFSAVPIFILQGIVTLAAALCGSFIGDSVINDLCLVGNALIFCVGLNLLRRDKISVGNLLPSLVVAVIYNAVASFVG